MHPLISAYLKGYSKPEMSGKDYLEFCEYCAELMSSQKIPELIVGFYQNENPCAEGILVWPLNGVWPQRYPATAMFLVRTK